MRIRAFLILLGAAVVALVYTVPFWQPLVQPRPVQPDTIIPGMSVEIEQTFLMLPQEQQEAYFAIAATSQPQALAMIRAAFSPPIPAPAAEQTPPPAGLSVVGRGSFVRIDPVRWGQGDITVYTQADNRRLMRFEDFSVANGPNLHVFLSVSAEPLTPDLVRAQNIEIDLGPLLGTQGAQSFTIAPEIELQRYASVVLYSTSLEMVYSYAPLFLSL
jgi:hypothetical protein